MSYITVEVDINHGRIVAREPEKLPEVAKGILTILPTPAPLIQPQQKRELKGMAPTLSIQLPKNSMPASGVISLLDANVWLALAFNTRPSSKSQRLDRSTAERHPRLVQSLEPWGGIRWNSYPSR